MFARVLAGLVLALLLIGPAAAASFDCKGARTPFAKAICSTPELSKADDALAAALKTALDGLSAPAMTEVQSAQDNWVKFANLACTSNAKPATRPYTADGIDCLKNLFSDRAEQLQHGKTIGGLRFYYVDRYAALKDPDPQSSEFKVATKFVSTPRIDGDDPEAAAFNRFIETGVKDDIDPAIATAPKPDDGTEDDANSLVVDTVNPVRISMSLNLYSYGHGAAHGNPGVTYIHYLRAQQRRLAAADVFAGSGWQAKLQTLALAAVKKAEGEDLMLDDPASINDIVIGPARWDFSKDGLILQFEPYEIAAYAFGSPTVTIPWADLKDVLAPGAADFQS